MGNAVKPALTGRVVGVRPREDGSFGVTLVLSAEQRRFAWFRTRESFRLGSLLAFDAPEVQRFEGAGVTGEVLYVRGGPGPRVVAEPWARRFVAPQWVEAASRASARPLYPHQLEGAAWIAQRLASKQGSLLADDQGLGKTTQALTALLVARAFPAILVVPSSLKINWQREVGHLRVPLQVSVVGGWQGDIEAAHIIILNYELLRARENQLRRCGARAIVFDEAHILKKPEADSAHRAAVATRLAKAIPSRLLLTGTPMPNKPHELWRILHVLDPAGWPSFDAFKQRYCLRPEHDDLVPGRELVTKHGRVHRIDELQARMAPYMLRRLKSDVLTELPPKERRSVLVDLEPDDRAHYDKAEKDVCAWLRGIGRVERIAGAARGQAIVKLQMLRRIAARGKLRRAVPAYLRRWYGSDEARPLVVFGYHQDVLAGARAIAERIGLRVASITGQDPDDRRQRAIDRFTTGEANIFIAPVRAAGVGINLQVASDVLFIERLWVPTAMGQAEDRVHRLGQSRTVTVTYLDARETVDEHIAKVLAAKQRLIDVVVDDRDNSTDAVTLKQQSLEQLMQSMSGDV